MYISSYGFHSIGSLYKMKKYKRIKNIFTLLHAQTLINWLQFVLNIYECYVKRTKDSRTETQSKSVCCACARSRISSSIVFEQVSLVELYFLIYFNNKIYFLIFIWYFRLKVYKYSAILLDTGYIVHEKLRGGKLGPYAFSQASLIWSNMKVSCNGKCDFQYPPNSSPGFFVLLIYSVVRLSDHVTHSLILVKKALVFKVVGRI